MSKLYSEHKKFLLQLADWIKSFPGSEDIPFAPNNMVCNSNQLHPTFTEISDQIKFIVGRIEHPSYVLVYRAAGGWQTMIMIWSVEDSMPDGGFYDTMGTGMGPYGHSKKGYNAACREAKQWAEDEDIDVIHIPSYSKK